MQEPTEAIKTINKATQSLSTVPGEEVSLTVKTPENPAETPTKERKLYKRERAFCYAFIAHRGDKVKAAVDAGYSESNSRAEGRRMLRRPVVQAELYRLLVHHKDGPQAVKNGMLEDLLDEIHKYAGKAEYSPVYGRLVTERRDQLISLLGLEPKESGKSSQTIGEVIRQLQAQDKTDTDHPPPPSERDPTPNQNIIDSGKTDIVDKSHDGTMEIAKVPANTMVKSVTPVVLPGAYDSPEVSFDPGTPEDIDAEIARLEALKSGMVKTSWDQPGIPGPPPDQVLKALAQSDVVPDEIVQKPTHPSPSIKDFLKGPK